MTALFDPARHEPLTDATWDPDRARAAIRSIIDAEDAFADGWPTHPEDSEGPEDNARRFSTVYLGGAGVVQALAAVQRRELAELRRDYVPYLERPYEPDFPDYDRGARTWPVHALDG